MAQDNELVLKLLYDDKEALTKARSSLKQLDDQTKSATASMTASWGKLVAGIAAVAIATEGFRRFMASAVTAAIEQEDAINRLNVALKSQGLFTDLLSKSYQDLASQFQRTSRFGDEAILALMQSLISIGNVGPAQMQRATQATLDLATALRVDLNTATLLVSKAAAGNTTALSRYGIVLDENIPKGQKFEALLKVIESRFGGAAQADINTYAGSVSVLQNAWSDLLEEVGQFITENEGIQNGIKITTEIIQGMTEALNKNQEALSNMFTGFAQGGGFTAVGAEMGGSLFKKMFGGSEEEKQEVLTKAQETAAELALMKQQQEEFEAAEKETKDQAEIDSLLTKETAKIEQMKALWDAYNQEDTANKLKQNQQETEMYQFKLDTMQKANQSFWVAAGKLRDTFSTGVSKMFQDAIEGNLKFGEAIKQLGLQMVKVLIDFAVQKAINFAISKALMAAHLGASLPIALAIAKAWATPAALVATATFGGAAAAGAAALSTTVGLAKGLANIPGLAEGGRLTSGGSVLVGELGPELLNLPAGAGVRPLTDGQGAGTVINIEINNPVMTSEQVAEGLARVLASRISEFIHEEQRRL